VHVLARARLSLTRAALLLAACSAACTSPAHPEPPAPIVSAKFAQPAAWEKGIGKDWPYDLRKEPVAGRQGLVTTDAGPATRVGIQILEKGGNAVDAAVAVAFALAVVYPQAGNVGGGGFLLVRSKTGEVRALDFRETAPAKATAGMFVARKEKQPDASLVGHLAAGVPGAVAGLFEAHARGGALPWKDLVAPAMRLAEQGFVVDAELADSVRERAADLKRFPASTCLAERPSRRVRS
jgi:gamma-glutamyltranspeptidase / glutathione hydrolase